MSCHHSHLSQPPCPVLGTILCHTTVWPRKPAICHKLGFQVPLGLWGLASSIYGQSQTSPMLGIYDGKRSWSHSCFPMASPAHDFQGCDGICAPCQPQSKMGSPWVRHNADAPRGTGSGAWGCPWVLQKSLKSTEKKVTQSLDGKVCGKGKGEQE